MDAKQGAHVIIVGLEVTDEAGYAAYRARITPLLEQSGGSFRYDFMVSRVLKTVGSAAVNRVFSMVFPDRATREAFFARPDYLRARSELFERSVGVVEYVAQYDE